MSDQGERWTAPGGDVNDYAPTDRSTGPLSQPNDVSPFAAPAAQNQPTTPQQTGSGVTMDAQQEPVIGRLTFSDELVEPSEGRLDFSVPEFSTPEFSTPQFPPPPLEPAAAESATSAFPAPALPTSDFPARGFAEQDFITQGFSEEDFPAVDTSLDGIPDASTAEVPGFEARGENFGGRFGAPGAADASVEPPPVMPTWDAYAFDGMESGAGVSNYAGVDMSGPGTPPKPGMPSSGNWRMPDWMSEEGDEANEDKAGKAGKAGKGRKEAKEAKGRKEAKATTATKATKATKETAGAGPELLEVDPDGGRSRVGLFAGVSLLVIALVAAAAVYLLKTGDATKSAHPATPTKAAAAKKKPKRPPVVALPPAKQLQKFTGTHSKVAGRVNDAFSGLSYTRFGAPWQVPTRKSGLSLLGWSGQQIMVTENTSKQLWYAQLLTGVLGPADQSLYAGPGYERAAAVAYSKATEARLYGFTHKTKPLASEPLDLNGHKGWLVSSSLTFHRAGVKATGDIVTVAVIDVGRKVPAVLLMAMPNTKKAAWPDINLVVNSLKVLPAQ
jgi:hypothetical protein